MSRRMLPKQFKVLPACYMIIILISSAAAVTLYPSYSVAAAEDQGVPPGITRVTVIHETGGSRTEVDHGPGKIPPPRQEVSYQCTTGAGTDQCDTNSYIGKKWFVLPVHYSVNLQNAIDDGHFEAAVKAGSQVWEDDPNSSFDATYDGSTNLKASGAEPRGRMDGNNVVDWGSTKRFGSTVIAVTVYWYYTATGQIVEADMRFNQKLPWSSNGGPSAISNPDNTSGDCTAFDVQNIAAHEFGHFNAALKDLKDASEIKLTMYGYGAKCELQKRTLGYGDQLSIRSAHS